MGPSGHFYSFIYLLILMIGTGRTWLELPVQGRLPDFRESGRVTRYSRVFHRLTGSQQTPRFGASQAFFNSLPSLWHFLAVCRSLPHHLQLLVNV